MYYSLHLGENGVIFLQILEIWLKFEWSLSLPFLSGGSGDIAG